MQARKQYGYKDCVQVLGWYNKQCWVCVIFFACVCVWARQIRQLRLTIPSPRALSCVSGAFLGGSQGGAGMPPPGYAQHLATGGSPGQRPQIFFLGGFCYF
jgi:hypothetical protein